MIASKDPGGLGLLPGSCTLLHMRTLARERFSIRVGRGVWRLTRGGPDLHADPREKSAPQPRIDRWPRREFGPIHRNRRDETGQHAQIATRPLRADPPDRTWKTDEF